MHAQKSGSYAQLSAITIDHVLFSLYFDQKRGHFTINVFSSWVINLAYSLCWSDTEKYKKKSIRQMSSPIILDSLTFTEPI